MDVASQAVEHRKLLVVDDTPSVHRDFAALFRPPASDPSLQLLQELADNRSAGWPTFTLDFALQGAVARQKVLNALLANQPFTVAFVDLLMPPGWDGITTAKQLWQVDPRLQIVLFSGRDEVTLQELTELGELASNIFLLRKPMDSTSVRQMAVALSERWRTSKSLSLRIDRQQQEAHQLSSILGATSVPMVVSQASGAVTWANAAAQSMLGLVPSSLGSVLLEWFVQPQDAGKLKQPGVHAVRLRQLGSHVTANVATSLLEPELGPTSPRLHTLLIALRPTGTKDAANADPSSDKSELHHVFGLTPAGGSSMQTRTSLAACVHEASAAVAAAHPGLLQIQIDLDREGVWVALSPTVAVERLVSAMHRGLSTFVAAPSQAMGGLTLAISTHSQPSTLSVRLLLRQPAADISDQVAAEVVETLTFPRVA